ncbi:hypothetical protein O181_111143 [Austropuccinia psidii MF-1]|uniref:Uncharacterized protein n=1 Tax=Austropuccinia psidii MF-1 TaxID=1389203 RepID=A0A9Q3PRG2_9BASI|nr:hypothetical protein [Austropuccinia psidii MF-1]
MPCHPWDSNAKQLAPGPSGTQWLEELFCKPSQYNEPTIPGPSQSSKPQVPSHEDALTCEPEPMVAPMQSTEDPFGKLPLSSASCSQLSLTPPLTIISLSHYLLLHNHN